MLTDTRLQSEIMPKLSQYASQGYSYPFLIVTYQLKDQATATASVKESPHEARSMDVTFSPRQRESAHKWEAIVYSPTEWRFAADV